MTPELTMLLASVGLYFAITVVQANRNVFSLGLFEAMGNLHDKAPWEGWKDRTDRALKNLGEALIIFTPIVLMVHITEQSNATTALGAQIFFGARVAHALLYIAGVPIARTLAWFAGVVGIFMVASALV